jgi:hypothetical protein
LANLVGIGVIEQYFEDFYIEHGVFKSLLNRTSTHSTHPLNVEASVALVVSEARDEGELLSDEVFKQHTMKPEVQDSYDRYTEGKPRDHTSPCRLSPPRRRIGPFV